MLLPSAIALLHHLLAPYNAARTSQDSTGQCATALCLARLLSPASTTWQDPESYTPPNLPLPKRALFTSTISSGTRQYSKPCNAAHRRVTTKQQASAPHAPPDMDLLTAKSGPLQHSTAPMPYPAEYVACFPRTRYSQARSHTGFYNKASVPDPVEKVWPAFVRLETKFGSRYWAPATRASGPRRNPTTRPPGDPLISNPVTALPDCRRCGCPGS